MALLSQDRTANCQIQVMIDILPKISGLRATLRNGTGVSVADVT